MTPAPHAVGVETTVTVPAPTLRPIVELPHFAGFTHKATPWGSLMGKPTLRVMVAKGKIVVAQFEQEDCLSPPVRSSAELSERPIETVRWIGLLSRLQSITCPPT